MPAIVVPDIYYCSEKWNRLRVLGHMDTRKGPSEAVITFVPFSQRAPAYGPEESNYDRYMEQFIGDHNNIMGLCDLHLPWLICSLLQVTPQTLGSRIKYLLRCSGDGYPGLLTNVQSAPDLYVPPENEIRGYFNATKTNNYREAVLEIQAYDNQIVLIGQSIGNPHYWPAGHKVWQEKLLEITAQAIGRRTIWKGDDIVLPTEISDDELGKHIQRMWLARMRTSYPPPEELEDFWQGIKD